MTRRALIAVAVVLSWLAGSTLGSIVEPDTARARLAGILIGRVRGGYTPEATGRRTITVLAIGSDARPGQNPLRSRADSIHVIFLHPRKGKAVVVGIPRDSWVSIPGLGSNKINAAMASGGPARMVQTVERNFGARIDYWAVTSFWGIADMVEQVGGLRVRIPFRMRDPFSGSNFHPGLRRLNGKQVLAFARDRKSVASGDFGRQENGGRVFVSALIQFRQEYRKNPGRLLAWIAAGARNMDTDLPLDELVDLAFTATRVRVKGVRNVVLPGGIGSVGGLSVVTLSMGTARAIFRDAKVDGALRPGNVPRSPTGTR
ncbi:MAG TPA: LCP family protein [Actinomycetota bacterium]|nr:LCP family protein [Actinomycetota bacterium]